MTDFFESASSVLPSEIKTDVVNRFKETKGIRSLELQFNGSSLQGAAEFGEVLRSLKRQGVKVSHEFSIKLDFPQPISRDKILSIVERMPKTVNGSMKVRIELGSSPAKAAEAK